MRKPINGDNDTGPMGSMDRLNELYALVSPFGLVGGIQKGSSIRGLPEYISVVSNIGLGLTGADDTSWSHHPRGLTGGTSLHDHEHATIAAIAEAAERYSAIPSFPPGTVVGSWDELDGPALDPELVPRCSSAEIERAGGRVSALSRDARIHWTRAVDLHSGVRTWVPAVMTDYAATGLLPAENFWFRISTGYAVHSTMTEALVRGILEVVERDALAITWLQRLPLPPVPEALVPESVQPVLEWGRRSAIETHFFDATLDLGVPTCLVLQTAPHSRPVRQVVGCATGRTLPEAVDRATCEVLGARMRFERTADEAVKLDFARFDDLEDGARYMARAEMGHAFEFLLDGASERTGPTDPTVLPRDPAEALSALLARLRRAGCRAYAVDRTSDELRAVGLVSACVVIPALQPMSLHPLHQYRAHPRLYSAPLLSGYRASAEEDLNPWPLPFD
ncbi:YcaO-like family protein [Kitasatospora sp. LaBMicrA B282]|uniref:YcaO-like family protein n=1 Tax=Kitasatospora sp. LaBMicrA B282 TaxID=3420949 RepID=UPI003D10EB58